MSGTAVAAPDKPHPAPEVAQVSAVKGVKEVVPQFAKPAKARTTFRPRRSHGRCLPTVRSA